MGVERPPVEELLATANELADVAREATLAHFRQPGLRADNKASRGFDPVTEADRAAERAMREVLAARRPLDAILGEELGTRAGRSGLTWVLDPIDGTRGFLAGTPTWGVLIAVADEGGPFLGMIDQPYIGERFVGRPGDARMTGPRGEVRLVTRQTTHLQEAVLFTTFPEIGTQSEARAFRRVAKQVRLTRYGMDCYAYALLAAGHVDLVIEAGLGPHDIAAPLALIEAAGGIVTNWQGGSAASGGQVVAAANAALHRAALDVLAAT
jgi:histidinol phosphatase-like enzyme (inositol monophosphatase family)